MSSKADIESVSTHHDNASVNENNETSDDSFTPDEMDSCEVETVTNDQDVKVN